MVSTDNTTEIAISALFRTLVIFALPLFFLIMYTQGYDWIRSDSPMYSNQFGIGSDRAAWVAQMLGPKLDFYLLILIEHGFAIILAASLCTPFVRVFYPRYGFWVTLSYTVAGIIILFSTQWPATKIISVLGSDFSYQLVLCGILLLPQAVYGSYVFLTSR